MAGTGEIEKRVATLLRNILAEKQHEKAGTAEEGGGSGSGSGKKDKK